MNSPILPLFLLATGVLLVVASVRGKVEEMLQAFLSKPDPKVAKGKRQASQGGIPGVDG